MPATSHRLLPLVRVSVQGTTLHAYLLAWVKGGKARVGWVEQYATAPKAEPYQWRSILVDVPRTAVQTLPGQSYVLVPQAEEARDSDQEEAPWPGEE